MQSTRRKQKKQSKSSSSSEIIIPRTSLNVPSTIFPNLPRKVTYRYTNTGAIAGQTFALADGHNQFLTVVATTGNAISFVDMWRIRRIQLWSIGSGVVTTIQPLSGDINNAFNSPERTFALSPIGTSQPGYLSIRPRGPQDPLGGWKETNNVNFAETLFVLSCTGGAGALIMDIDFEFVLNIVGGPNGYAVITSTTVLGTLGSVKPLGGLMQLVGSNQL
jgi:hypothetical protein